MRFRKARTGRLGCRRATLQPCASGRPLKNFGRAGRSRGQGQRFLGAPETPLCLTPLWLLSRLRPCCFSPGASSGRWTRRSRDQRQRRFPPGTSLPLLLHIRRPWRDHSATCGPIRYAGMRPARGQPRSLRAWTSKPETREAGWFATLAERFLGVFCVPYGTPSSQFRFATAGPLKGAAQTGTRTGRNCRRFGRFHAKSSISWHGKTITRQERLVRNDRQAKA
jgi:hypothetical protein